MTTEAARREDGNRGSVDSADGTRQRDGAPDVPVGNSPPGPHWPLYLAGLVWFGWEVFLFLMMLSSRAGSAV